MQYFLFFFFIFIFGLCIGSFLNVCIYRIPKSESIMHPPSKCPGCGQMIKFYDNIPIISYLILKGKCRNCGSSISSRYPIVELLTGLFALAVVFKFGLTPSALIYFAFIACLLVITFIDIDYQIIPNIISLPGIGVFFVASFAVSEVTIIDSILGIIAGGGILFLVAWIFNIVTGREGMGQGDMKLMAMIGALVGWKGVLVTIFLSSLIGSLVGLMVMIIQKSDMKMAIPFGPFLAIGSICHVFFGPEMILWYFSV